MALSAAAVCSYMGAYWFLWQSIVSILVIPVYEKAMYDAIIVVILMILRGILNIASATCSHYLGFRLETNLRKNGLHKLLDASSSFFDHNSSGEIRKIIDDNAAETHKTVAHLIPDNVTAVMTPVLMFVLMFAIDYRLGILLILTTVIGVLQYRKMSGGTEFLSGYSINTYTLLKSMILGHQQCAGDQVERLICDQFRRRKVRKSNIAAADCNGLRRLVDAV